MLGDIIARLEDYGTAEAVLVEAGDLALLADVRAAADHLGMETGRFVSLAVRRYLDRADDDAWLRLAGVMGRSDTPGLAAVSTILRQAVADAREVT